MSNLKVLPAEVWDILNRYGFDEAKFMARTELVANGDLSILTNTVVGKLEAPDADYWPDPPARDSEEREEMVAIGTEALANGEVGAILLNGGMATRFGGLVKGIVEAIPGKSFLSLKVTGILKAARDAKGHAKVFLMNSFATDEKTRLHFADHANFGIPDDDLEYFNQGISIRITPDGKLFFDAEDKVSCYGPGHGDCPVFFRSSGCLERFMDGGGKYLFISNVDNLAARLDPVIVGSHILSGKALTAEVAPKWPGDQGGAPVSVDGKVWVVEGFRFPEEFDQDQVPVFNTNTFTVNAESLDQDFDLTACFVEKTVSDMPAVQIETLLGALTRVLDTQYLRVKRTGERSRFFPIKTPQDLAEGREDLELICGLGN